MTSGGPDSRILVHYLGGEEALTPASRATIESHGISLMAAADRATLRKLASASPADALLVSLKAFPMAARAVPALRRLYGRQSLVIVVLMTPDQQDAAPALLSAGADDALPASVDAGLLAARLEAAIRTAEQFAKPAAWPKSVVRTPDDEIAVDVRAQRCLVREGGTYREVLLTRKQLAALLALLRASGKPVPWTQFFRGGWRPGKLKKRSRTLVQHVLALRRKLGKAGARIRSVPGSGYRLSV